MQKEPNRLLVLAEAARQNPIQPKVLDERQEAFLAWVVTPESMRIPATMQAYSEVHDISYPTLKRWKNLAAFRQAYEKYVKENIASPERVQFATDYAYDMAYGGNLSPAEAIKWANHWADLAGLKKQEPGLAKSASEAMADLTDEELDALVLDAATTESKRRATGTA